MTLNIERKQGKTITTKTTTTMMGIKDLKERKTRLHRLVRYMVGAELILAFLVSLAYANYLAVSSDSIFGIFFVAFTDTLVVLIILDIILSD